jgi:hypothetical protein
MSNLDKVKFYLFRLESLKVLHFLCEPKACYQLAQTFKHPSIQYFKRIGILDRT